MGRMKKQKAVRPEKSIYIRNRIGDAREDISNLKSDMRNSKRDIAWCAKEIARCERVLTKSRAALPKAIAYERAIDRRSSKAAKKK